MKLKKFYADSVRLESRERDLGLTWAAADGTSYRAAWIEDTEEIYAVAHLTGGGRSGRSPEVELLGVVPANCLDGALAGWQEVCGEPDSFSWLRGRVEAAAGSAGGCQPTTPPRRRRARKAIAELLAGGSGASPAGRVRLGT